MIYAIGPAEQEGPIKIGYTEVDPEKRLRTIQTNHPDRLTVYHAFPGDRSDEAEWHEQFAADRLTGEWFKRSDLLIAELAVMGCLYRIQQLEQKVKELEAD